MGDHRIVGRIRIFGDVEIFLDDTPRVREEGPVSADTAAIFVRLSDVVRTDRDKPAIANLHLTMEFKKPFSLSAVLGAETAAAEDEHHGMLALQVGELPAFRRVIGKFVVGENGPWNNVRSHMKSSTVGCASPGYVSMVRSRRSHSWLSQRAAPGTLSVKNRQSLGPMRRSHRQPYPVRKWPASRT